MGHISEVLRLAAQGLSQREISTSVGISRTSVRNYLARAKRAGLSWPLSEQLDAATSGLCRSGGTNARRQTHGHATPCNKPNASCVSSWDAPLRTSSGGVI